MDRDSVKDRCILVNVLHCSIGFCEFWGIICSYFKVIALLFSRFPLKVFQCEFILPFNSISWLFFLKHVTLPMTSI